MQSSTLPVRHGGSVPYCSNFGHHTGLIRAIVSRQGATVPRKGTRRLAIQPLAAAKAVMDLREVTVSANQSGPLVPSGPRLPDIWPYQIENPRRQVKSWGRTLRFCAMSTAPRRLAKLTDAPVTVGDCETAQHREYPGAFERLAGGLATPMLCALHEGCSC
jgi:hypothetical protein